MSVDLYEVLGVSHRASPEVIKAAFTVLAKQNQNDTPKMTLLIEASKMLLDPKKREAYDNPPALKGKAVGPYRIMSKIAEGGFGITYAAQHALTGCPVCIKHASRISSLDEEVLISEAKAVWDLRHYSLPVMRDLLKMPDGSVALVMSYIPGKNLADIVDEYELDPEDVAWITGRVLNALRYLHYHGVVHGDVKPQNIIIQTDTHTVVLVDFGLSLIRPNADSVPKGYTPYFASPEQVNGKTLVPESDFYSLGMTMAYALGGNVESKSVPATTPDNMIKFIKGLISYDVHSRPNWEKMDLEDALKEVRQKDFGRTESGMKPFKKRVK